MFYALKFERFSSVMRNMTNTYQNGWDGMNYKLNDHIRDGLITLKIPSSSKIVGPWASTLTFEIS